jgi:cell division initiation protein
MQLTPADIEKTTFSTALRGYDLNEVDDFLDKVVVAIRDLEDELYQTKASLAGAEKSGGSKSGPDEAALGRVFVAAQKAADRLVEDAKAESDLLREGAKAQSDLLREDAKAESAELLENAHNEAESFETLRAERQASAEAEMAELTTRVAGVRTQLALLATAVADRLDEMDSAVSSVVEVDGHGDDDVEVVDDVEAATDGAEDTVDDVADSDIEASGPDSSADEFPNDDDNGDEAELERAENQDAAADMEADGDNNKAD